MRGGRRRLERKQQGENQTPASEKRRVLFVCMGNSCRSQMAEAFARVFGSDVLIPSSAGLAPAPMIAPLTRATLAERNVVMGEQFPKGIDSVAHKSFDVLVNISGYPLPDEASRLATRVIEWNVADPIGRSPEVYRAVAQQLEAAVMRLILELRG